MSHPYFLYDSRIGIHVPVLEQAFEQYTFEERQLMIVDWENIRGTIPTRVMDLEKDIELKLTEMGNELNFEISCRLNGEIADLASKINELHIWYRISADVIETRRHM